MLKLLTWQRRETLKLRTPLIGQVKYNQWGLQSERLVNIF